MSTWSGSQERCTRAPSGVLPTPTTHSSPIPWTHIRVVTQEANGPLLETYRTTFSNTRPFGFTFKLGFARTADDGHAAAVLVRAERPTTGYNSNVRVPSRTESSPENDKYRAAPVEKFLMTSLVICYISKVLA